MFFKMEIITILAHDRARYRYGRYGNYESWWLLRGLDLYILIWVGFVSGSETFRRSPCQGYTGGDWASLTIHQTLFAISYLSVVVRRQCYFFRPSNYLLRLDICNLNTSARFFYCLYVTLLLFPSTSRCFSTAFKRTIRYFRVGNGRLFASRQFFK